MEFWEHWEWKRPELAWERRKGTMFWKQLGGIDDNDNHRLYDLLIIITN